MLNQFILVGRLTNQEKLENERGKATITLAVTRAYKNTDGEYETDFVDIVLWGRVADQTLEYCKNGDVMGVKGRIQTRKENDIKKTELIAEKITFLSSKKVDE